MPEIKLDLKRILAYASVVPLLGEAQAAPLGLQEDARVYYVAGLFLVSSALAYVYFRSKAKAPIEVVSLAYDKDKHKIELTVKNKKGRQYCMKSVLRLVQSPEQYFKQNPSVSSIPMAAARMSGTDRKLYQLLCEDMEALVINPHETKTLSYDVVIPQDNVNINPDQNVEVSISYGEDKKSLVPNALPQEELQKKPPEPKKELAAPVKPQVEVKKEATPTLPEAGATIQGDNAYSIKVDENYMIAEIFLLEDLLESVRKAPPESVEHHMRGQNDFALWINSVIKDVELANSLNNITYTSPDELKSKIVSTLECRISALKHPYLQKVPQDKSFVLKVSNSDMIAEAFMLEDLLESIKKAPEESIKFHTRSGNDFSAWISEVVGDKKLASDVQQIDYSTSEAKNALEGKLEGRIIELKRGSCL